MPGDMATAAYIPGCRLYSSPSSVWDPHRCGRGTQKLWEVQQYHWCCDFLLCAPAPWYHSEWKCSPLVNVHIWPSYVPKWLFSSSCTSFCLYLWRSLIKLVMCQSRRKLSQKQDWNQVVKDIDCIFPSYTFTISVRGEQEIRLGTLSSTYTVFHIFLHYERWVTLTTPTARRWWVPKAQLWPYCKN